MLGINLPSDWNVPPDEDCEEAVAAHHGELVARQMAKVIPEALPWDEFIPGEIEMDCA